MSKERALVVEDNLLNQKFTKLLLEKEGYEVCVAEDGMQALGLIETFNPDLILMDMQLPIVDGSELTQLIRSEPGNKNLLIIALTAHRDEQWRQRALDAGCDAYLTKPVSIAGLREALSQKGEARISRPVSRVNAVLRRRGLCLPKN
jgi:two-component system cell cycle response regulator DivK